MKVETSGVQGVATSQRDLELIDAQPGGRLPSSADCVRARGVEELAKLVNEVCRSATFDLAFKIGHLIIHSLYDGSICEWRKHGTNRPSYRALAARNDLLLSPSALCRSVGVYVLTERLGGRQRWQHLCVSHMKEVLPLPECEQEQMLEMAERGGWTVAELRHQLSSWRGRSRDRWSPRVLLRSVRRLDAQLRDRLEELQALEPCSLAPPERVELQQLVESLQEQLSSLCLLARGGDTATPRATE